MLKAVDQSDWTKMYVYQTNVYADLHSTLVEFLSECEHANGKVSCVEISPDTVDDVTAWTKRRKEMLLEDFTDYLDAQAG